jgi:hypothetical protein
MKRFPWFEVLLVTAILAINLRAALSDAYNFPNAWFTRDDAYYYFKVAQNLSEGHGSSFDGINPTNGYHPLWMLVCTPIFALARFDLILPLRILVIALGLLNAATALLIFRLLSTVLSPPSAVIASAYWAFNPHLQSIIYTLGLEAGIAAFFVVMLIFGLYRLERSWRAGGVRPVQIAWLSALALLAVFSRLDLIILAGLAGLWIVLRGSPARFLLMFDIPLLFLMFVVSVILRTGLPGYYSAAPSGAAGGILAVAIKVACLFALGLYQHPKALALTQVVRRTMLAQTISSLSLAAILLVLVRAGLINGIPREALLLDWGLSTVAILSVRLAGRRFGREAGLSPRRPDAGFGRLWRDGLAYYGPLGLGLGLYMLWNRLAFGTFTPVSGQIKYWWGSFAQSSYAGPPDTWLSFLAIDPKGTFDAWSLIVLPLSNLRPLVHQFLDAGALLPKFWIWMAVLAAGVALILLANPRRVLRAAAGLGLPVLAGASALQVCLYTALPYAGVQEWYWIGETVATVLAGAVLVELLFRWLGRLPRAKLLIAILSLGPAALMALRLGGLVIAAMPDGATSADVPLMDVVVFLEENTPPGATIGMTGGGNVGYFIHDRTIVNMDGLINSYDYFLALKAGTGADYLSTHELEYVFANLGLLKIPPYLGQFEGRLTRLATYGGKSLSILLPAPSGNP